MIRRKAKQKGHSYPTVLLAIAVCALSIWWLKATFFAKSIRFDLRQESVSKEFTASHGSWAKHDKRGLRLVCPEPCYVLSPFCASTWEEYPYLKMKLAEFDSPSAWIFWVLEGNREPSGIRLVRPMFSSRTLMASAEAFQPWSQQMPWHGQIDRVGIRVPSGRISISEIVLADSLTPWEWAQFAAGEYLSIEPLSAYSINIVWGASIHGWSLTIICGCLAVLALLIALYARSRRMRKAMIGLAVGLVLAVDSPFLINLVRTSAEASTRSAWRNSREEEETSRFGAEYAGIVQGLRREAPAGSTIFIPDRRRGGVSAESDWMIFQLWPQYRPAPRMDAADYIILLHPTRARYDASGSAVVLPDQKPVRVVPIVDLSSEAMLLKRKHDQ